MSTSNYTPPAPKNLCLISPESILTDDNTGPFSMRINKKGNAVLEIEKYNRYGMVGIIQKDEETGEVTLKKEAIVVRSWDYFKKGDKIFYDAGRSCTLMVKDPEFVETMEKANMSAQFGGLMNNILKKSFSKKDPETGKEVTKLYTPTDMREMYELYRKDMSDEENEILSEADFPYHHPEKVASFPDSLRLPMEEAYKKMIDRGLERIMFARGFISSYLEELGDPKKFKLPFYVNHIKDKETGEQSPAAFFFLREDSKNTTYIMHNKDGDEEVDDSYFKAGTRTAFKFHLPTKPWDRDNQKGITAYADGFYIVSTPGGQQDHDTQDINTWDCMDKDGNIIKEKREPVRKRERQEERDGGGEEGVDGFVGDSNGYEDLDVGEEAPSGFGEDVSEEPSAKRARGTETTEYEESNDQF